MLTSPLQRDMLKATEGSVLKKITQMSDTRSPGAGLRCYGLALQNRNREGRHERREMQEERNPGGTPGGVSEPMGAQDEKTWSVIAHLSVLAAFVGLMPFGALLVWLLYKDRSARVRFHAAQAFWYQVAWIVIFIAYALVTVVLSIVTLGIAAIVLVPLAFLLAVVPLAHGCYAAYKVNEGEDYRYPFIADKIDGARRTL